LSRDPIEEEGGWNLYNFVANSPILMTDILGLKKYSWKDILKYAKQLYKLKKDIEAVLKDIEELVSDLRRLEKERAALVKEGEKAAEETYEAQKAYNWCMKKSNNCKSCCATEAAALRKAYKKEADIAKKLAKKVAEMVLVSNKKLQFSKKLSKLQSMYNKVKALLKKIKKLLDE
jgi:chromosome segregation ATPase